MVKDIRNLTYYYNLNQEQYNLLLRILSKNKDDIYAQQILLVLYLLEHNLPRLLSLVKVGNLENKYIFVKPFINKLYSYIKEVIILTNYKQYIRADGTVNVSKMARAKLLEDIKADRFLIARILNKYKI